MIIPTKPPTPWQGNTSNVSSNEVLDFPMNNYITDQGGYCSDEQAM